MGTNREWVARAMCGVAVAGLLGCSGSGSLLSDGGNRDASPFEDAAVGQDAGPQPDAPAAHDSQSGQDVVQDTALADFSAAADCGIGHLHDDAGTCQDIDECLTDNGGCSPLRSCENVTGGRTCGPCPEGYDEDGSADCRDVDDGLPGLVFSVNATRYQQDLAFVAQARVPPRDPSAPDPSAAVKHWQAVQDLCAERFEQLGFTVRRQPFKVYPWGIEHSGVNVIGELKGTLEPEKQVVVSAHYDHITGCTGADDNASGVAGVLESARVLSMVRHERTLIVACWDQEELSNRLGAGSMRYVEAYKEEAAQNHKQIVMAYVYEMIGYKSDAVGSQEIPADLVAAYPDPGPANFYAPQIKSIEDNGSKGDFIALVHDEHASGNSKAAATELARIGSVIGLPSVLLEVPSAYTQYLFALTRSDHWRFWRGGYPAIMLTDTAEFRHPYYHCWGGEDSIDLIDTDFAVKVVKATVGSAVEMLEAK